MSVASGRPSIAEKLARAGGRNVRRYVNESVYRTAKDAGAHDRDVRDFVCECGDLACTELVRMPLESFDESSPPGSILGHAEDQPASRRPGSLASPERSLGLAMQDSGK